MSNKTIITHILHITQSIIHVLVIYFIKQHGKFNMGHLQSHLKFTWSRKKSPSTPCKF